MIFSRKIYKTLNYFNYIDQESPPIVHPGIPMDSR